MNSLQKGLQLHDRQYIEYESERPRSCSQSILLSKSGEDLYSQPKTHRLTSRLEPQSQIFINQQIATIRANFLERDQPSLQAEEKKISRQRLSYH